MPTSRAFAIALALVVLCSPPARAQAPAIPDVVADGLNLLLRDNRDAAVEAWGRAWTGADTAQSATLRASLNDIGALLGRPRGYELVQAFDIGPNVRRLYIVIRYDKQPLFAAFLIYRPSTAWQVNAVRWNTDATLVFPASLVSPL